MLLTPSLARIWTPRLRWIILDEIHSIGQQPGGAIWEQLILFAPCPIIGLSATIGNPDEFSNWLSTVQKQHGFQHHFIQHKHRYSHLRKFFYALSPEPRKFRGLDIKTDHQKTSQNSLQFIHPISVLPTGVGSLPDDLALESRDCLTLFTAMKTVAASDAKLLKEIEHLDPRIYFAKTGLAFLKQSDILDYEADLKKVLTRWMNDRGHSQHVQGVVSHLSMKLSPRDDIVPHEDAVMNNLIHLMTELHQRNELPGKHCGYIAHYTWLTCGTFLLAILFNFERHVCDKIAQTLTTTLQKAQEKWRESNAEWKLKVAEWEKWESRAKLREKDAEKLKKAKPAEGVGRDELEKKAASQDRPWQESFDPEDPNPQFSFASEKTSYSKEELLKDIAELRRMRFGKRTAPDWAIDALRLGIAVHHDGMNKKYKLIVESYVPISS